MKYLFLFFPLVLISCSDNSKTETGDTNKQVIDSLTSIINSNNDSIRRYLDHLPAVSVVVSPASVLVRNGENFEAKVCLAGHLWLTDRPVAVTINNAEVPVKNNVATYRMKATQEGLVTYNGVAKIARPDGTMNEYPFTGSYYVSSAAPARAASSEKELDSIYRATCEIPRGAFPGKGPVYEDWLNSTLDFGDKNIQDAGALNHIMGTQDSILDDLRNVNRPLRFDSLVMVITPVASVIRPGDEYVAFIYLAGTSITHNIEIQCGNTSQNIRNGENISVKAPGTGMQEYSGTIFYEELDKRDSIPFSTQYFVEEK